MKVSKNPIQNQHKPKSAAFGVFLCILAATISLYSYIDKQNDLTELRLAIPNITRELREIREENTRLHYEIERFESPIHLMELMRKPEYSHLKFPYLSQKIFLPKSPSSTREEARTTP